MDQVRVALAWIKRHHFWLLCGLVTIISATCWHMASTTLQEEFTQNSSKIKSKFDDSSALLRRPYHPNEVINNEQRNQNRALAGEVRNLWSELYNRQREEVLRWPGHDDFVRRVERLSFGDPIQLKLRERYQNYIEEYFPELPKIVKAASSNRRPGTTGKRRRGRSGTQTRGRAARRFASDEEGSRGGGVPRPTGPRDDASAEEVEEDFYVLWNDQERIQAELDLATIPSALRMWVIQEDLWVYETLLRAIAKINQEADTDRYSHSAVRDIDALEVGQLAAASSANRSGRIRRPEGAESSSSSVGTGDEEPQSASFGRRGSSEEGAPEGEEEAELLQNRYIDAAGNPLPVTLGNYKYGTEFKRLPVRLVMRMDQRWLPRLITELSNAPLPVEITEVRINADGGSSRGGGSRPRSTNRSRNSGGVQGFNREPSIGEVILAGTVYIYNQVDEAVLTVADENAI